MLAVSVIFTKLPKVSNHPLGSPNLVTQSGQRHPARPRRPLVMAGWQTKIELYPNIYYIPVMHLNIIFISSIVIVRGHLGPQTLQSRGLPLVKMFFPLPKIDLLCPIQQVNPTSWPPDSILRLLNLQLQRHHCR
jgi:hypothetical protein